jgi:hypothetical protein
VWYSGVFAPQAEDHSCEREHGWRALVSTPCPTFSSNSIPLLHRDSYYSDMPDARV